MPLKRIRYFKAQFPQPMRPAFLCFLPKPHLALIHHISSLLYAFLILAKKKAQNNTH
jgi:hypothetical protein